MEKDEWKEKTKIDKNTKVKIGFHICMIILCTVTAIVDKDFTWILCALLWGNLTLEEWCNAKLSKGKDVLISVYEKQNEWLWKELLERTKIIDINLIKIPEHYTEPKQKKLEERWDYAIKNGKFKVPVIVDENYNLKDGYTSYLVAKSLGLKEIEVKVVSE